ncbi:hypothetical protein D3C85_107770 [compost metagenome]
MSMRFYLRDALLPEIDKEILNQLGVDRDEFVQNVIYGELTRDPSAYDESVICSMDDFLVQNLTELEYAYFMTHRAQLMIYEQDYIRMQTMVARYLKPLLKHGHYEFDLRLQPNHGHYVDLVRF